MFTSRSTLAGRPGPVFRLILGRDANMFDKSLAAVVGPIYFFCQIWAILGQTIFATWEAIIAYLLCPIVLLVKIVSTEN